MGKEYAAKSFKSGNSVAIRMPVALGVAPDQEWRIHREDDGRIVILPKLPVAQKIDLTGIWGSCPGLKPLESNDRVFEERKLDWEGKFLDRG